MSDTDSGGAASSSHSRPPRRARLPARSKLRNGTWIIPGTRQRTRRQFTLRHPNFDGSGDDQGIRSLVEQETVRGKVQAALHNGKVIAEDIWAWLTSPKGRGTIKCSVAYLLASLWTFYSPFARFLGPMDGKHIVATITVYFHPSRTAGSQIEAVAIAVVAVLYALLIGTLSMATSVLVGSVWELAKLSYALILILFIGGGLGFVAWVKQKLNNPLVSVGASIASIGIITIVTKENSVHTGVFTNQKIIQSLKILLIATTTSTAVNLLLWPLSARIGLRSTMRSASVSLGDMLSMTTRGFLSGAEEDLNSKGFSETSASYSTTLATMNKHLRESKYEYYLLGREEIYKHDKAVVRSMESLAQSLGGLKSAANTQFELLKEISGGAPTGPPESAGTNPFTPRFGRTMSGQLRSGSRFAVLSAIDEAPDERSDREDEPTPFSETGFDQELTSPGAVRTPSDIFELFITRLGPSMKSLVHTLSEILREPSFGAPGSPINLNENFKASVTDALSLFNSQRGKALEELYRTIELERSRPENVQADYEEVSAACGHFSFSLLSLGDEMQKYLDALDDLKYVTEQDKRTWNFLKFWKHVDLRSKSRVEDPEQVSLIKPIKPLRRSKMPKGIPDNMTGRRDTFSWEAEPQANRTRRWVFQHMLRFFRFLSREDIRFGLKVGIGATLYAMFAFIPQTRPIYQHWRGEWGLLSFMIVCSMTVGASNTTGLARFVGTLMGAVFVLLSWWLSGGDAIPLAIFGWAVSFLAFYITIDRGNAPFGRFILLTYNVSSLYAYSLSQKVDDDDDDEGGLHPVIQTIAYHRVVAVSLGILWGLVVCRVIWPVSARRKLKEGLCVLYLQMGLIWKRGPLAILLRSDATDSYMKMGEQAAMQRYASQLQTLRAAASSEYELRGPFPTQAYSRIMTSTQRILDAFNSMNLVTQKHGRLSEGEKALLYHTSHERAELCARICHVFQVLASSVMLEYPLTDAIPSVIGTRDKLLGKIFRFRKEHNTGWEEVEGNSRQNEAGNGNDGRSTMFGAMGKVPKLGDVVLEEPDYALLYAYALVTGQVAKELKVVETEVEGLFGRLDEDAMLLQ
ncbi:Fusaric acid resistance protein-like-domain-containing protein [Xylariales sp. AK1849]|nr:Fusaric acid resistance protein-like-domain-containing protein [Xylariales sp. AK1849]